MFRRYHTYSCTLTWLGQRIQAILTKFSLLCESSNKFAPKWKALASNNEAIMTYWTLKNTFFTFHKPNSVKSHKLWKLNIFNEFKEAFQWQVLRKNNWQHQNYSYMYAYIYILYIYIYIYIYIGYTFITKIKSTFFLQIFRCLYEIFYGVYGSNILQKDVLTARIKSKQEKR